MDWHYFISVWKSFWPVIFHNSLKYFLALFQYQYIIIKRRILHKVVALCHTSLSGPQYLSDRTHVYTPAWSLHSSSDTRILSTLNVKLKSYDQRSFAYHGPTAWNSLLLHSDINKNLIASSELWKLICFLSINKLNTSIVFCYFHLPTINTTLVINKWRHLSYYWH